MNAIFEINDKDSFSLSIRQEELYSAASAASLRPYQELLEELIALSEYEESQQNIKKEHIWGLKDQENVYAGNPVMVAVLARQYDLAQELIDQHYFHMEYALISCMQLYHVASDGKKGWDVYGSEKKTIYLYQILIAYTDMPEKMRFFFYREMKKYKRKEHLKISLGTAFFSNSLIMDSAVDVAKEVLTKSEYLMEDIPFLGEDKERIIGCIPKICLSQYIGVYMILFRHYHFVRRDSAIVKSILNGIEFFILDATAESIPKGYQMWLQMFEQLEKILDYAGRKILLLKLLELAIVYRDVLPESVSKNKKDKMKQLEEKHVQLFAKWIGEYNLAEIINLFLIRFNYPELDKMHHINPSLKREIYPTWYGEVGSKQRCNKDDPLLILPKFISYGKPINRNNIFFISMMNQLLNPIYTTQVCLEMKTVLQSKIDFLEALPTIEGDAFLNQTTLEQYHMIATDIVDTNEEDFVRAAIESGILDKRAIHSYLTRAGRKQQMKLVPLLSAYAYNEKRS